MALDRGDLDRAVEYHQQALAIVQALAPNSFSVARSLTNLAVIASARGDLAQAVEYHQQALEITQALEIDNFEEAEMLYLLATVRRRQDQPLLALELFRQAIEVLEDQIDRLGGSHDIQAGFQAQRGNYYRDALELELEQNHLDEAFHTLERSRAQSFLAQLAERSLMFTDIPDVLDRKRRRLAKSYDRVQQEIADLNTSVSKEKIEALRSEMRQLRGERDDVEDEIRRVSPKMAALQYPQPLDFESVQQILDPGTVMLSYSVGKKQTNLFVISKTVFRVENLLIGEARLKHDVQLLRKYLFRVQRSNSRNMPDLIAVAKHLYATLIQPAADVIGPAARLLIIPDGPLHFIPVGALIREKSPEDPEEERSWQYLVEWKPLHSVLSATVYAELKQNQDGATAWGEDKPITLAAFGDPSYPENVTADQNVDLHARAAAERGFNFHQLPHTRHEVESIATLFPQKARKYLGLQATEEQVQTIGKATRILHFATHGKVDHRFPLNSFLALTIPREFSEKRENGLLQVWEIYERLRLDADLVVLSACESGLGQERGGDGLIGLTRAFQYAGARTVVASLWRVEDQATAELMVRFYKHLIEGQPKDQALRAAQLELIRAPIQVRDKQGARVELDATAPYFWAAFQAYGDWR